MQKFKLNQLFFGKATTAVAISLLCPTLFCFSLINPTIAHYHKEVQYTPIIPGAPVHAHGLSMWLSPFRLAGLWWLLI